MTLPLADPPEPSPAMRCPDDQCTYCGSTEPPLSPGRPEPMGPGVERETAVCLRCLRSGGLDQ